MRSSNHITLLRGGHEEYLEEIADAWPHVLEYVELDRTRIAAAPDTGTRRSSSSISRAAPWSTRPFAGARALVPGPPAL